MNNDKELKYYNELAKLYEDIPENKRKLCDGLLLEAARLKVSLDELWEDILVHGNTITDEKGNEKERPTSAIFTSRDKSYRACIKHLDSLLPAGAKNSTSAFSKLDDDEEDDDG